MNFSDLALIICQNAPDTNEDRAKIIRRVAASAGDLVREFFLDVGDVRLTEKAYGAIQLLVVLAMLAQRECDTGLEAELICKILAGDLPLPDELVRH
jgi:hypothetical protein